jgi:hypothetical protein
MALCPAIDAELIGLLKIVRAAVPPIVPLTDQQMRTLTSKSKPADEREAQRILTPFKVAFTFVHCCDRAEKPDRTRYMSHWAECAEECARQNFAPRTLVQEFTTAAIIANADVPYSLRTTDWEAAAGLLEYGGGRRAGTVAVPIFAVTALSL